MIATTTFFMGIFFVPTTDTVGYEGFQMPPLHPLHIVPDAHKVPQTYPFEYWYIIIKNVEPFRII